MRLPKSGHMPRISPIADSWNPVYPYDSAARATLEWCRIDAETVIGRVTYHAQYTTKEYNDCTRRAHIVLEANSPWHAPASFALHDEAIVGRASYRPRLGEVEWDRWLFHLSTSAPTLAWQQEDGYRAGFQQHRPDETGWHTVRAKWFTDDDSPLGGDGGYGWYRQGVTIPETWRGHELEIHLGNVWESDHTFLNGALLEQGQDTTCTRVYRLIPGDSAYQHINWGEDNYLAVQVQASAAAGGPRRDAVEGINPQRPRIIALADAACAMSFVVVGDQAQASMGTFDTLQELQQQMQEQRQLSTTGGDRVAGLHYGDIHLANKVSPVNNVLRFVAKVGSDRAQVLADARLLLDADMLDAMIRQRKERYAQQRVTVDGAYSHAAAMISNAVEWGALYSPEQRRTFTVDCRSWTLPHFWTLFANSAVMTAWACGLEDAQLAQETFRGVMAEQLPDGRVMNAANPRGGSPDHSEDMYDAYVLWKLYLKWRDTAFLREMYPHVKAWNGWWFANRGDGQAWRDGNGDGLLGLGSNLSSFNAPQAPFESELYGHHHQMAMNESGYDDSPMWGYYPHGANFVQPGEQFLGEKRVRFLFASGTFNLDDVETNCLYALDTDILALLAEELGFSEDAAHFRREYQRIKGRINDYLWDEETGTYLNRFWPEAGGEFSRVKTPIMFYALAAGIPSAAQARRLVEEHLLNPAEFWGEYVLPTVSRDDPCFVQQNYWRGAIWPPMNYFAFEGLKRYGYDAVAAELAEKTYDLVKKGWEREGALFENYQAIDGESHWQWAHTSRHYNWSTCLPLLLVMECIDYDAWDGLRFGSIGLKNTSVKNIVIAGHRYHVRIGTPTVLEMDEVEIFHADAPVTVRGFRMDAEGCDFVLKTRSATEAVSVTLHLPQPDHGGCAVQWMAALSSIADIVTAPSNCQCRRGNIGSQ